MRDKLNRRVEDLFRLGRHFPFFFGEAVIHEHVDMRYRVKGDLFGEQFRLYLIIHKNTFGLVKQLIHSRPARP